MPKAHFDCHAVCQTALEAATSGSSGIHISTNHPAGFRRLLYKHMRANPLDRLSILQSPASPNRFLLVPIEKYEEAMANAPAE